MGVCAVTESLQCIAFLITFRLTWSNYLSSLITPCARRTNPKHVGSHRSSGVSLLASYWMKKTQSIDATCLSLEWVYLVRSAWKKNHQSQPLKWESHTHRIHCSEHECEELMSGKRQDSRPFGSLTNDINGQLMICRDQYFSYPSSHLGWL